MKNQLNENLVTRMVREALREDIGLGDITSLACIAPDAIGKGRLIAKAPGVICGLEIATRVFREAGKHVDFRAKLRDGLAVKPGTLIATVRGPLRTLLVGERTALNFLQHLSGVATLTRRYVDKVKTTDATILDTRKTTPLFRELEKYAVRMGGGQNHRSTLDEMILIKDNHIEASRGITGALLMAERLRRTLRLNVKIEVEVESIEQVREVLLTGIADRIMLDNFSLPDIRRATRLINRQLQVEVSGGVNLKTVAAIAKSGVDFISVGALTHSAPALDMSLELG